MSNNVVKIETDLSKLQTRTDEILNNSQYGAVKNAVAEIKQRLKVDKDLVALCAPQIGINLRLFVIKTAGADLAKYRVFLNPMVVNAEGLHLSREVNASLPGKQFIIPRKDKVHVAYQRIDGQVDSETYIGVFGEVIQQMIEMLDGITLADYGLDLDDIGGPEEFDNASDEEKTQVLQMYLDSLKDISADMRAEIEANPELKRINDTIDFTTKMLNGEIKPIDDKGNIVEFKTPEEQMEAALAAKGL